MNRKAAIVGGGVIGGGWAARLLLSGWDVAVFDPHPESAERVAEVLKNARASTPLLADVAMPQEGTLSFAGTLSDAVSGAQWIQESVPENLDIKRQVLGEIEALCPAETVIGSSTSGFKPSELQEGRLHPERILVAHPFNPVYLLPLVELVAGESNLVVESAKTILRSIGMFPLEVRKEIDAHIADRLLEAVWREALWLVHDDVATTQEIDDAIRFGFGLRWAQMGLFETYRLAGGEAGMEHFIKQFGPALKWPWTKLMDVPDMTDEFAEKIAAQSDQQSGAYSLRELEAIRDRNLVGFMRLLKEQDWGAGRLLNEHDAGRVKTGRSFELVAAPLQVNNGTVLPGWIDYNNHMTDWRYAQVFSETSDRFLTGIGLDDDYLAGGNAFYTVEMHINYAKEIAVNTPWHCTAQLLESDAKRLRVFFELFNSDSDEAVASAEAMYLHVNKDSGRVTPTEGGILDSITHLADLHARLDVPPASGRFVGQR